jgi:alanyl-tRNA synthetase
MQQHSGQHLLSQIFYQRFGYETVSVHFGAAESTLDLDVAALDPAQIDEAERYANDLVYATLPIKAYFVTEAELASVPLRRPPKVTGIIRIVEIDQFDYSACGGTHVRTTAEIGPIKLTRQERRRGQVRITFLCGKRAHADYTEKHRLLTEAANLFSTDLAQVPKLIERNLSQIKDLQRSLEVLTEKQLTYEAAEMAQVADQVGPVHVVARLFEDKDTNALKTLATLLQQQTNSVALLGSSYGDKLTVIFARSADVNLHMGNLLRDTLRQFGGNGGGRPDFAQGGVADSMVGQDLLNYAVSQVKLEIER